MVRLGRQNACRSIQEVIVLDQLRSAAISGNADILKRSCERDEFGVVSESKAQRIKIDGRLCDSSTAQRRAQEPNMIKLVVQSLELA